MWHPLLGPDAVSASLRETSAITPALSTETLVGPLAAVAGVVNSGNADQFLGQAFYFVAFALSVMLDASFVALVVFVAIRFA